MKKPVSGCSYLELEEEIRKAIEDKNFYFLNHLELEYKDSKKYLARLRKEKGKRDEIKKVIED
jgi:hypothetical protein